MGIAFLILDRIESPKRSTLLRLPGQSYYRFITAPARDGSRDHLIVQTSTSSRRFE